VEISWRMKKVRETRSKIEETLGNFGKRCGAILWPSI
jgi:hypothetical protein